MRSQKRLWFLVLVLALGTMLVAPLTAAAQDGVAAQGCTLSGSMYVNAYLGLRLRATPSLAGQQVAVLWNGEYVKVIACDVHADGILWSNVEVTRNGVKSTGWASAAYLSTRGSTTPPPASCGVSTDSLRLRATPSLSGAIRRIVPMGTTLLTTLTADVAADGYTWRNLNLDGSNIWAARTFLRCTN
jgi:hypothetical protein